MPPPHHHHGGGHGGGGRRGGGWRGGWGGPDVIILENCPPGFYRDEDENCYPVPTMVIAKAAAGLDDAGGPLTIKIEHAGSLFNFQRGYAAGELSFPDTDTLKRWGIILGVVILLGAAFIFRKRL